MNELTPEELTKVKHPKHYKRGEIEVIEFIEDQDLPPHLTNVLKYICRYRDKGTPMLDLSKAQEYLERYINWVTEKPEVLKRHIRPWEE